MSHRAKRIATTLVSLVVLAAIVYVAERRRFLSGADTTTDDISIAPKTFNLWAEATGVLRATSVQNFGGPPAFGNYWQFQIVSLAPEGNNVRKDDTLIRFDAQRIAEDLQRVQNELDQAAKELEKTRVQTDLERQELTAQLAAAENRFEKLKLKQRTDTTVESSAKIEEDRVSLEQSEREVALLKQRFEAHARSSDAATKIIASKKAQAENKLNVIQKGMANFEVKADRDGVVVYKTRWNGEKPQVGQNCWSGETVMQIPDLNTILAEAFVPEVDIGKIKLGQPVEITIDALPGKSYSGTVKNMGTLVRAKAWDIPNKVLDVQIALDRLDTSVMRPGMSIKVKIETERQPDVIAAPLKAVRTTAEGTLVKIKSESGWREQKVKLGDSNGVEVIVAEGLKPGDRIASDFSKAK
jgi:HlyD family secretion protein